MLVLMKNKINFLTLNFKGLLVALFIAVLLFYFGGPKYGFLFVLSMLIFLFLSGIVTNIEKVYKKNINLYEPTRGVKNVLSNGLPTLIMAFLFFIFKLQNLSEYKFFAFIGFVCVVSAITADKFSSELGVLDGQPRMIFGFKKVKKGVSGGITPLGLLSGLFASLLIATFYLIYFYFMPFGYLTNFSQLILLFFIIFISGFIGTVLDSILGYFETKKIGTKHTTNFIASLSAGFIGILLFLIIL